MSSLAESLRTTWVADDQGRNSPAGPSLNTVANWVLWPMVAMLLIHRIALLSIDGAITDDFTTVYEAIGRMRDGIPVYNENYMYVDPHYLWSPGATILLFPFSLAPLKIARLGFIIINALSVLAAIGWFLKLIGEKLSSCFIPLFCAVALLTESVRNTLIFSNINGVLLLLLVGFYYFLMRGHTWWAGVFIGFAIVFKPIFLPLLVLPLVKMNWKTIAAGLGVPLTMNLIAWPLVPGAGDYLTRTMPYISTIRDFSNSSLRGMALWSGAPGWLTAVLWVVFAIVVAAGVIALLAFRYSDRLWWIVNTSTLLLAGVFFLSSLGQMYYSMFLFPFFISVIRPRSLAHNPLAWFAAYFIFTADSWKSATFPVEGMWVQYFLPTAGWAMLILVIAVGAVARLYYSRPSALVDAPLSSSPARL